MNYNLINFVENIRWVLRVVFKSFEKFMDFATATIHLVSILCTKNKNVNKTLA